MSERYLVVAPGVDWHEVDGSVLVLHGGLIHLLTDSSAEIWQAVDGSSTTSDLAAMLSRRHPESTQAVEDVARIVSDLTDRGLLIRLDHPTGSGYRVPAHVAWVADDHSVIVADLRSGVRRALTPSASAAWAGVAEGESRSTLLASILELFPDAPTDYASDVDALLDSLVEEGLLARRLPRS